MLTLLALVVPHLVLRERVHAAQPERRPRTPAPAHGAGPSEQLSSGAAAGPELPAFAGLVSQRLGLAQSGVICGQVFAGSAPRSTKPTENDYATSGAPCPQMQS
eukprot:10581618-Lingulodinium_polyedra.AAC.1